jgi:methionyl-tRNA formyltransferase
MKIQILISKSSWANYYKKKIKKKLNPFCNKIIFLDNYKKLKNNYDINIIFSYFKIIPQLYLNKSKINLVPHESDLPKGKGMSPLTWQILENKKKIIFSLIEATSKVDSGNLYYQEEVVIPSTSIYDEIRLIQLNENIKIIIKFLNFYKKKKVPPQTLKQMNKEFSFYKTRKPKDSKLNINKNIIDQFNLLRISDPRKYPNYFIYRGIKYYLRISKS